MIEDKIHQRLALLSQLCWFISLRWIAAACVIAFTLADWLLLHRYRHHEAMLGVGLVIGGYNAVLYRLTRPSPSLVKSRSVLTTLACAQILLDLACLTLLTMWTGDLDSPLTGLFVLHMVLASLLLPGGMAYAGAGAAILMLSCGLLAFARWPDAEHTPMLVGWAFMLVSAVFLANHVSQNLRRHRQRVLQQNRRIRMMSDQLRRQRQAMIQHEKMVAMGQMAAGVAHEITNPLANMDGMLQLLQRKPERITDDLAGKLREQVARISNIVRQLTQFAHPPEAQWRTMSVGDLVGRALEMVRFDHRLRQVRLDVRISPQPQMVMAQPQAIEQVLVNLILNALDAMTDVAEAHLEIRTEPRDDECRIVVADNGHGITAEHMNHLFEPFFTTKPVGKGTGLGLSISYSMVRHHGGRIEVQSQPNQGARFTICLPAAPTVP